MAVDVANTITPEKMVFYLMGSDMKKSFSIRTLFQKNFLKLSLLLKIILIFWCGRLLAQPDLKLDIEQQPAYDYSKTVHMYLYAGEEYVILGDPIEGQAPGMGALVYELILLYVPQFQQITIPPPEEPSYVLDLLIRNHLDPGNWLVGQRLIIGDAWLSDGKQIAFMKPEDYQHLKKLLDRRLGAVKGRYKHKDENLRYAIGDEIPKGWSPGPGSVDKAIQDMTPSNFEFKGYDPGLAIRSRAGILDEPEVKPVQDSSSIKQEVNKLEILAKSSNTELTSTKPSILEDAKPKAQSMSHQFPEERTVVNAIEPTKRYQAVKYLLITLLIVTPLAFLLVREFRSK